MRNLAMPLGLFLVALIAAAALLLVPSAPLVHAEDDHGDYRTDATPMDASGGRVSGVIDLIPGGLDVDYFSFQARRGVRYTFVLEFVTVQSANLLVVNSMARGIGISEGQSAYQESNQKKVEWIARTSDTYFVEVSAGWEPFSGQIFPGTYSLRVEPDLSLLDQHCEFITGATPIGFGNQYQGAISPWSNQPYYAVTVHGPDDQDYFSFQANRGVKYTVDVELGTVQGVAISMVNADGITQNSNDGVGTSLEWISSNDGIYFVVVSGTTRVKDPVGTYAVKLSADSLLIDRHADDRGGATSISFGNAHQGAISPSADQDFFSFQTKRGVGYTIQVESGTAEAVGITVYKPFQGTESANGGAISNDIYV